LRAAKPIVDGFWEYVAKRGGNTNPHRMAFTQICCVAETDEQAERDYHEAVRYFYTHNPTAPGFAAPPGYQTLASVRAGLERGNGGGLSGEDRLRAARGDMSFWEYDDLGFIVAGTPKRVRERLRELASSLRVGQLIACLHVGNLPGEVAEKNTTLFGTEVIPYLRDLWADEPDYWTPKLSQERVAANAPRLVAAGGS
jgi:alkanesulfonate monooxygenase SsuD/methylene tetrahydromethanopterin reductase-like flavin-dependent oxidoreductase (luciferase family)